MRMRDIPVVPTIVVLVAVTIMIALGVWQLGRADEKEAMLARYETAAADESVIDIYRGTDELVYQRVRFDCVREGLTGEWEAVAGRNDAGQAGYVHRFACDSSQRGNGTRVFDTFVGGFTYVEVGWSRGPAQPEFDGGVVVGRLAAIGDDYKVVSEEGLSGLEPSAQPNPNDIPNNHLAYAGQWFFFALTALVIYFFALRSRVRAKRKGEGGQE